MIIQKPLQYDYASLEPFISEEIMKLHFEKHHATYIKNANEAILKIDLFKEKDLRYIIENIEKSPSDIKQFLINNLGGHINHEIFWEIMTPQKKNNFFSEKFISYINKDFGSIDNFFKNFKELANKYFGSGWIWLAFNKEKNSFVLESFLNQNTPQFKGLMPIMGIDLWEHAYYLQYKNRRTEYIDAWFNILNKNKISDLFEKELI